jgi:hypothetical protein
MSAPKAKLKWGRRGWEKIEQLTAPADNIFASALHHLNSRITSIETQFAALAAPVVKPMRSRKSSPTKE